ncbi:MULTISPECIES: APC family permease [unclassified Nocardioides]|uniref:APC family permease n=1 Tax=unclassified Nocardioides TaxID=2615069 RepID=UPI0009F09EC4|nr:MULTISPECIES: amino acid permease [unclassified Nocardioides]GAW52161.1 amino acid permease-associated protein [Nocardioides sp. PD653-B2]GAW55559.1 amino acid permease-associated protein [Nocardioides sp. PD653]
MTAPLVPDQALLPDDRPASGLGVTQGAALTLGAVLGTGVISLPALAAHAAGPASLVAWLALVLLSIPLATTFAALGARYPDGGGVSTYVRRAFGGRPATVIGWCFYFAIPLGAPAAAGFAGAYVADSLGGGRGTQLLTTAALIVVVTTMNWYGIRVSGRVQLVIAAALATLLFVATVVSLPHADLGNLTPFAPHGWMAVGSAAALLIWAFAGWEVVTSLSADYRDPARDITRATWIAIAVMGVMYLGVAFATVAVLGDGTGKAPLSDLLVVGFGEPARAVTTVVAVLLSLGAMNAFFAGGARLGAALGRDASLPRWFAHGSVAGEVPRRSLAVITGGALATLLVITLTGIPVERTMLLVTGAFTLVYVVGTAAAIRLLPRGTWVWRGAVVAFASTLVLLGLTGRYLLPQLVLAVGAIAWTMRPRAVAPAGADPA